MRSSLNACFRISVIKLLKEKTKMSSSVSSMNIAVVSKNTAVSKFGMPSEFQLK